MKINYSDVVLFWQNDLPNNSVELDNKLDSFRVLFAYNSNRIENENITYHDTREIFENGKLVNYTGDTRTIFEIENQKNCYEWLLDKIISKEPISNQLIQEMHYKLTHGTFDERRYMLGERPGEFKKHDYVTGKNEVGTSPEFVADDLHSLLRDIKSVEKEPKYNALTVAAYLHASFEYIHPFADGNGRVGRTLMNYYLITHDHPPLIVYDEDKKAYYSALEKYDLNEELSDLISFLKDETVKTWSAACQKRHNTRNVNAILDDNTTIIYNDNGRK